MVSERVFENLLIFEVSVLDLVIFCTYIEDYWCFGGMESRFLFMEIYTVHLVFFFLIWISFLFVWDQIICLNPKSINSFVFSLWIQSYLLLLWPKMFSPSLFIKRVFDDIHDPVLFDPNITSMSPFPFAFLFCAKILSFVIINFNIRVAIIDSWIDSFWFQVFFNDWCSWVSGYVDEPLKEVCYFDWKTHSIWKWLVLINLVIFTELKSPIRD